MIFIVIITSAILVWALKFAFWTGILHRSLSAGFASNKLLLPARRAFELDCASNIAYPLLT